MITPLNNLSFNAEVDKVSFPRLENYSEEPVYNTKAAVRLSGVPAPTLRAWERRYGVLSPERAGNTYRLYSERDVARIRWLREQVERGISIRQAALLLTRLEANQADPETLHETALEKEGNAYSEIQPPPGLSFEILREELLQAFMQMDEAAAEKVLARALAVHGLEEFCEQLLGPVMNEVGEKWAHGEMLVTVEHFASAIARGQLVGLFRTAPHHESGPLVLVGCAPHEQHEIGLLMLSLFLRWQGLRVIYLGQNVPAGDFMTSVQDLKPALVCISCSVVESLGGLMEIARQINALPKEQQPIFGYGGRLFQHHPELTDKLPGYYLSEDAVESARKVRDLLRSR